MGICNDVENDTYGGGQVEESGSYENQEILIHAIPSQFVLLKFKCQSLHQSDKTSKSDPFIVIEELLKGGNFKEVGRTEVVVNNNNPSFAYSLKYLYKFEELQKIKISVYDADESGNSSQLDLSKQDYIGSCESTLSEIVVKGSTGATFHLVDPKNRKQLGAVNIFAEEVNQMNSSVQFSVSLLDFKSRGKIFYQISTINQSQTKLSCFRSETALSPGTCCNFTKVTVDSIALCNGDEERPIIFTIYQYKSNGSHTALVECKTKLSEMRSNPKLPLTYLSGSNNQRSYLTINDMVITPKISFLKYIQSGCEINFMVGIDFTGSNGDPNDSDSLHYFDANNPNQYERSIISVGGVLEYYDTDKLFPSYLFGGSVNGHVEHCYPLNGNYSNPELPGIQGILQWYRTAISNIQLYGPTCFAPLINAASCVAKQYDRPNVMKYLILLILTDGVINDMDNTVNAIINSCMLPLSIIIIGVGNADFSDMDRLDGDHGVLKSGGNVACRDIVQFVPLGEILSKKQDVASLVLQEVPRQLTEYMAMRSKFPTR